MDEFFALTPDAYRDLVNEVNEWRRLAASQPGGYFEVVHTPNADWRALQLAEIRSLQIVGSPITTRFNAAIRAAIMRRHRWLLTLDEYLELTAQPCYVCGGDVGEGIGLDRIDHRGHYMFVNVLPCCGPCNIARGRTPLTEWMIRAARAKCSAGGAPETIRNPQTIDGE